MKKRRTVRERGAALRIGHAHPDYIIGQHWLSVAYERICAGEHEIEVMKDYGYRVPRHIERAAQHNKAKR